MPRLSRPTLKPKASSAWVTALSDERDCANAPPALHSAAAATLICASLRHECIGPDTFPFGFLRLQIICARGSPKWRRDELFAEVSRHSARGDRGSIDLRTVERHKGRVRNLFVTKLY